MGCVELMVYHLINPNVAIMFIVLLTLFQIWEFSCVVIFSRGHGYLYVEEQGMRVEKPDISKVSTQWPTDQAVERRKQYEDF